MKIEEAMSRPYVRPQLVKHGQLSLVTAAPLITLVAVKAEG